MSTFNEADHPRVANGQFTDKPQSAPEVGLVGAQRVSTPVAFRHTSVIAPVARPDVIPEGTTFEFALDDTTGEPFVTFTLPDGNSFAVGMDDGGVWFIDEDQVASEAIHDYRDYAVNLIGQAKAATDSAAWKASEAVLADVQRQLTGADDPTLTTPAPELATQRAELVLGLYDEGEDGVADALTDLLHLAKAKGYDFDDLLDRAERMVADEETNPLG